MALVLDRETAPFRLLSLPKSVWSEISALLDARSIAVLGCLSPAFRTFIRSSHVIAKLHILVPADSRMQLTEWPFQWFEPYPSLVSIGLSLNAKSQLRPFTYETPASLPSILVYQPLVPLIPFADPLSIGFWHNGGLLTPLFFEPTAPRIWPNSSSFAISTSTSRTLSPIPCFLTCLQCS